MQRRVQLANSDPWTLTRVEFIGVSEQVYSTTYELSGPEERVFSDRALAEAVMSEPSELLQGVKRPL